MAGSVNRVFLIGRLGKDPEVRSTQAGDKIANLTMATSEAWKSQDGERKERTEWHRVSVLNNKIADVAERFLKKGSLIAVEGSLQTRKWTDQQGQERYTTEVVIGRFNGELTMLDSRGGSSDAGSQAPPAAPRSNAAGGQHSRAVQRGGRPGQEWAGPGSDLDSEIPF